MKYTVTTRISTIHALGELAILFCRAASKEAAASRFESIFGTSAQYNDVKEGWDFDNIQAKKLFTQEAMDTLAKDYSPSGIYQELFGKLQRDWNAFPHYSFEYAEVWNEYIGQNTSHEKVCTSENPAPARDSRGWFGVKTWNTKYSHPDAVITHIDELQSKFKTCPHCQAGWVFESDEIWEKRRKRSEEMKAEMEKWQKSSKNTNVLKLINDTKE